MQKQTVRRLRLARVSEFGGLEWWTGMVDWNGGMEWWNGMVIVEWIHHTSVPEIWAPPKWSPQAPKP